MDCRAYQDLLQRKLDGEATVRTPELERHLETCSACRELDAAGSLLLEGLKGLSAPALPTGFSERMTALVLKDRQARRRRVRARLLVTAALAACVLLMALAANLLPRSGERKHQPGPLAHDGVKTDEAAHGHALDESVADARAAVVSLSERWTDQAKAQGKVIVSAANALTFPDMPQVLEQAEPLNLEPAARSLKNAGQEVAMTLEPVTRTARRAFAYFVNELPALEGKN
jgi:predicted anti-sigma-YlaC factor YlaD